MKRHATAALFLIILCGIAFSQAAEIQVVGVDAKLGEKNLTVEIIALNKGASDGKIKITTNYFGQADERQETVPADSTKKFTYTIHNVHEGNVRMAIENGSKKFVEITIPQNTSQNQDLFVREITAEDYLAPTSETAKGDIQVNPYLVGIGIAAIVLAIVAMRVFKKEKKIATEQMKFEKNAELVKQADEAKKGSNIKKIRLD